MGAGRVVSDVAIPNVLSNSTDGIAAAVAMAKSADTVVLGVGTDLSWSAEGHDAKTITFTDAQLQLISQCAEAAKKPIIVVIFTATPLDITPFLDNAKVGAILHVRTNTLPDLRVSLTRKASPSQVGQPSVTTLGIGDVLFGKKAPAGRMIQTIYPASYQDEISIFDFHMR